MSSSDTVPHDSFIDWTPGHIRGGRVITHIYVARADYIIYSYKGSNWFKLEGRTKTNGSLTSEHKMIVTDLSSQVKHWASKEARNRFITEVAHTLSCVLDSKEGIPPATIWEDVRARIDQYTTDRARALYVITALVVCMFAVILTWLYLRFGDSTSPAAAALVKSTLFGSLGAGASVLFRASEVGVDSKRSPLAPIFQGLVRTLIGGFFGVFSCLAIQSEVILSMARENPHLGWAVAFISGFSERFIPEAISRFESKRSEDVTS